METLEAKSVLPFIRNSKIIGIGTTAICFKMSGGMVFKLFKYNDIDISDDFYTKINRISSISNDTYIAPQKLLIINDKIRGYFYPYVNAHTLRGISSNTKISELFKSYEKLVEDTKEVSNKNFRLYDLHSGNILFDGNYYIIDLDRCCFSDKIATECIFELNISKIFKIIIKQIYKTEIWELPIFEDKDIEHYLNHIKVENIDDIYELIRIIANYCNVIDPTIKEVRSKIKVKNVFNEYYKF